MSYPEYLPKKYHPRIYRWDDKRPAGKPITIVLRAGWEFPAGSRKIGVVTVRAAMAAMRSSRSSHEDARTKGAIFTGFCPDCGWKLDCLENTMHATAGVRRKRYACLVCGVTATISDERVTFESGNRRKNQ